MRTSLTIYGVLTAVAATGIVLALSFLAINVKYRKQR